MSGETSGGGGMSEATGTAEWVTAGPWTQLKDDTAVHVDLAGYPICLARSGGTIYAVLDECSHGQVLLSEGDVEDGYVECWMHGSRFDLATGIPIGPPATQPVPVYPVRTIDGSIEVSLPVRAGTVDG
ncbi:non-heme iron oxygenase ferredoxin subunit [Micromonosporaceae bacterium Da 78-11]